ncbi:hypothetical protein M404DRAFT_620500 [Pisolithus tinctorius Marx 270]|uniref:Uncharacterized protein n=1 Tax=Pisolithus tinctorius Marx 270 TaxID=870435 RepID=A0A0C3P7P0_PISTI|nr:hypothetical protein M404DRAFT_620500 [Pisolithus tinctorius Marx 270]
MCRRQQLANPNQWRWMQRRRVSEGHVARLSTLSTDLQTSRPPDLSPSHPPTTFVSLMGRSVCYKINSLPISCVSKCSNSRPCRYTDMSTGNDGPKHYGGTNNRSYTLTVCCLSVYPLPLHLLEWRRVL